MEAISDIFSFFYFKANHSFLSFLQLVRATKTQIGVSVPNAPRLNKINRKYDETYTIKILKGFFDIIHIDSSKIVGTVYKINGAEKSAYAIKFPEEASQEERMMIVLSILHYYA